MNAIQARIQALHQYVPAMTKPDDLEEFWKRAGDESGVTLVHTREKVDSAFQDAEVYRLVLEGASATPIHGWYLLPPGVQRRELPCIVTFPGYSGSKGQPEDHAAWLLMGYAVLALDVRGQGGDTGNELPQRYGMTKGWVTQGILSAEDTYYRAVAIDVLRAIRCALTQPEVDPARVFLFGCSQGGGLALLAAALEPRVRAAVAHVPNMCHMDMGLLLSTGSLTEAAEFITRFPEKLEEVLRTLSYFDVMNLAERIKQPVLVTVGLKDTVCLPETVFAAYNRIASPRKSIEVYPFMGHAVPPGFHQAAHAFFAGV